MSNRLSGVPYTKWQARHLGTRGQSRRAGRVLGIALTIAGLVAACSSDPELGSPGYVAGFAGAVITDEPHAALVGRDMLAAGGSAGDAAAATFLALSVTKPASAGLMAYGFCIDYSVADQTHKAYRFESPGAVRTMAAIHARLGVFPWRQVVSPAEALARFTFKRSLAFAHDWQAAAPLDAAAHAVFGGNTAIGTPLQQLDLATVLGQIREQGGGSVYSGGAARLIWQAAAEAGFRIDQDRWRKTLPAAGEANKRPLGDHTMVTLPFQDSAGTTTAANADSSLVAVDSKGNAVACVFSMGRPFGSGRLIGGVFFPVPGVPAGAPVLVTNPNTKILLAAIAGGQSRTAVEEVAEATVRSRTPLERAVQSIPSNAIVCPKGLPNYPESCTAAADPTGKGMAAIGEPKR
jgi:gamma-glutamyltranspeptidase / glutathione hydrolase